MRRSRTILSEIDGCQYDIALSDVYTRSHCTTLPRQRCVKEATAVIAVPGGIAAAASKPRDPRDVRSH